MGVTVLPTVEVAPGVHVLERFEETGWGWNVVTVQLPSGGTLVYSPAWLDEQTLERVAELGTPRVLCAPNHFHHLTLERFRDRWPAAVTVASRPALRRLEARAGPGIRPIEDVAAELPAGARWHLPGGTKTGEVWLSLPQPGGVTLLVCDAFFNITRPTAGFTGFALRRLQVVPGLRISHTYRLRAVSDVAACRASSLSIVNELAPTGVVFSHGETLRGADCAARLRGAIEARWPT